MKTGANTNISRSGGRPTSLTNESASASSTPPTQAKPSSFRNNWAELKKRELETILAAAPSRTCLCESRLEAFDYKTAFFHKLPLIPFAGPLVGAVKLKPFLIYRCAKCSRILRIPSMDVRIVSTINAVLYGVLLLLAAFNFNFLKTIDWWPIALPIVAGVFLWTTFTSISGINHCRRFPKSTLR